MDANLDDFLSEASRRSEGDLVTVTIRELIEKWGAQRRGYHIVERIRRDLARKELTTDPTFTRGWIDNKVQLVPQHLRKGHAQPGNLPEEDESETDIERQGEIGLQMRSLPSASQDVCRVSPQTDLLTVQSLMIRHDYSQLAVLSGDRDPSPHAISWESIAQATLRYQSVDEARHCMIRAEVVELDDELLPLIPRINDKGFVLIRGPSRVITGIVTPSDITTEFAQLARPFFLVGELERRLRASLDRRFNTEELAAIVDPDDRQRTVESADDLSIGEYVRLLENPAHWGRMEWAADRQIFIKALQEVREIRNEVMHFSPDPLVEEDIQRLRLFIRWLRMLEEEMP